MGASGTRIDGVSLYVDLTMQQWEQHSDYDVGVHPIRDGYELYTGLWQTRYTRRTCTFRIDSNHFYAEFFEPELGVLKGPFRMLTISGKSWDYADRWLLQGVL